MTLTNLQKAENEWLKITSQIVVLEERLQSTQQFTKEEVELYQRHSTKIEADLGESFVAILNGGAKEVQERENAYKDLVTRNMQISIKINSILAKIPRDNGPNTNNTSNNDIKLPKLDLPEFHGDHTKWSSFRDIFTAAVHNKGTLSNVEKLFFLQSKVKGEASRLIATFPLTDGNYDLAWKALTGRYENEREQIFAILKKLLSNSTATCTAASVRNLLDTAKGCIQSFLHMKGTLDHLFCYILFTKMDTATKELWFQSNEATKIPPLEKVYSFLEQRAIALSAGTVVTTTRPRPAEQPRINAHHVSTYPKCPSCKQAHRLYRCQSFLKLTPQERHQQVKSFGLCFNCLSEGHTVDKCNSSHCKIPKCNKKHNTLLHVKGDNDKQISAGDFTEPHCSKTTTQCALSLHSRKPSMLGTAVVQVRTKTGIFTCRMLLDPGSQTNLISSACAKRLGLRRSRDFDSIISGVGKVDVDSNPSFTNFIITPHFNNHPQYQVEAYVLPEVSHNLPPQRIDCKNMKHLDGLELADPHFHIPSEVDILVGSEISWDSLLQDVREGNSSQPKAHLTRFGWVVAGKNPDRDSRSRINVNITNVQLNSKLEQFWDSESTPATKADMTPEEKACEEHFTKTIRRNETGRFVVSIPWRNPRPTIHSRQLAVRRFQSMERRLSSDKYKHYKEEYVKFMREYIELGHMTEVPAAEVTHPNFETYFIPHQFVLKEDSTTTKFRVVFDASAPSSTGASLNDCMMVGPTVQSSLYDICLRFRMHPIAFTADVAKMYRQILLTTPDSDMHRILWREDQGHPLKEYRLHTITYGTGSASYLATRCLQQLVLEEGHHYPRAATVAARDFYVDDIPSGAEDVPAAIATISQLTDMCSKAGMQLRKWTCNNLEVINSIPEELREKSDTIALDSFTVKTLGIYWHPKEDVYSFNLKLPVSDKNYTKRSVLSEISSLFDPIGWLAPVTLKAKLIMQEIWKSNIEWDSPVPDNIRHEWIHYRSSLSALQQLRVPRYALKNGIRFHLIGFSDASQRAYAAAVYVYAENDNAEIGVNLLTSKTRVAAINSQTLPRLELEAAVLLAELMSNVKSALHIKFESTKAFTDSTITLAWIKSEPAKWKTYVRNRIIKIHEHVPAHNWWHIRGEVNPADCASRGLNASELTTHPLWWNGYADALTIAVEHHPHDSISQQQQEVMQVEEKRIPIQCNTVSTIDNIIRPFSTLSSLKRGVSLIKRLINNHRTKSKGIVPTTGPITAEERQAALFQIIQLVQHQCFEIELKHMKKNEPLPNKSKILSLSPFLDEHGLIRVGGRLRHSRLSNSNKHPILIPKNHYLTNLIISDAHIKHFHAGNQATLAVINRQFWIINARDSIRFVLKKCVTCTRQRAQTMNQLMGDLPESRVTPSTPFTNCGVDYAGPFSLKPYGRSKVMLKCYLVVFVCFSTRAIHLEVTTSLTTDGFLAAFKRFVSRRGKPSHMYSDCGTNFIGAKRALDEYPNPKEVVDHCADNGITWHLNPPGAPHFGGLWEAGVKSVKYHMKRVIGQQNLTYEEMITLVTQIEGILNSRPLTPVSSDPDDLEVLTPGHFLIGKPLTAIPEPSLEGINSNRLSRWQLIQQRQQQFWQRWHKEFISRMQQRPKWMQEQSPIKTNDVVIIKDENLPPMKWKLGRVQKLHPGKDGLVRVVELKTESGTLTRPIHKLCLLPTRLNINSPEVGLQ